MNKTRPFLSKGVILALFVCSLVPWTISNGLTPVLPLYAMELGASPADAGFQLAVSYAALAAGSLAAWWLSDRLLHRRALIVAGGATSIPALWLMGQVREPWALAVVSAAWCFCAGLSVSLVNILAGLFTAKAARGKVFGLLSLNAGLGALLGGLAVGPMSERWGYPALFAALSLFGLLWPVAGCFVRDPGAPRPRSQALERGRRKLGLSRGFYCLFLASLAATLAAYVFIAGRSLAMARQGFGATAISTTSALSELPILPLPLLLGWLSDRFGRRRFLIVGYLAASGALLGLASATCGWQFWACSILVTLSLITDGVGIALVADLVPQEDLSEGLSLFAAKNWIAAMLGCAGAGYAVQHLGPVATFVGGALLPLAGVALLSSARRARKEQTRLPLPAGREGSAEAVPATA